MDFENETLTLQDTTVSLLDNSDQFHSCDTTSCQKNNHDITLEQEIGAMIIMGFESNNATGQDVKQIATYLRNNLLGGIILFGHNIVDPQQLNNLTSYLKNIKNDILIAVDQEGGIVLRLNSDKGFTDYPSAADIGAYQHFSQAKDIYRDMALELKAHGFNLNFGPVVDLNDPNAPCPVIGGIKRSFGENPEKVVDYATTFIDAHHEYNILTAIKHFPGHGFASEDSHLGMVDVTNSFKEIELEPFYQLIKSGKVDMVMTAHVMNRNYDSEYPATLSPIILQKLLRAQGYNGVIISDDLFMGAILEHYNFEQSVILAVNAGCDLLIFSNNPLACENIPQFKPFYDLPSKVIAIVKNAILNGIIKEETIHQSFQRINAIKEKRLA